MSYRIEIIQSDVGTVDDSIRFSLWASNNPPLNNVALIIEREMRITKDFVWWSYNLDEFAQWIYGIADVKRVLLDRLIDSIYLKVYQ